MTNPCYLISTLRILLIDIPLGNRRTQIGFETIQQVKYENILDIRQDQLQNNKNILKHNKFQ